MEFKACCLWAACLFMLYALLILASKEGMAGIFLPAGVSSTLVRLHRLWARMRHAKITPSGIRKRVPAIASDLFFLVIAQQGFIQTRVEMDRGNTLGAILCLTVVTPLLSITTRQVALAVGNRIYR